MVKNVFYKAAVGLEDQNVNEFQWTDIYFTDTIANWLNIDL